MIGQPSVLIAVILTACSSQQLPGAEGGPLVRVTGGEIRGASLEKGGAVFKGIPFAAPPVGDLRWKEPQPVRPWAGIKDTIRYGPPCAQNPYFVPNAKEDSREDCLYLNVWTPEWPGKSKRAVMVWIPGGGNFAGTSGNAGQEGEALARRGVVVVSINYRLGLFGFFSHPALTRESRHNASGNQGILDQIYALQWVRNNIAKFGGDPSNVTIFGESAAALDVGVLMTTPLSSGLFRRVIAESGAVTNIGEPEILLQAEKRGEENASRWNVSVNASVGDLRKVSAAEILKSEPNYLRTLRSDFPNLGITVDGYVFPKKPVQVFAAGKEHRVDLLMGNNSGEWVPGDTPPKDLDAAIEAEYGPLAAKAKALYLRDHASYEWSTDTSFRCSAVTQLIWHTAAGNRAFEFQFDRAAPPRERAVHASEINYVFGSLKPTDAIPAVLNGTKIGSVQFGEIDRAISEVMQRYWTNFAKNGDPNGVGLPRWPAFDAKSRAYIEFTDRVPAVKEGLRRPFCDLFMENLKAHSGN